MLVESPEDLAKMTTNLCLYDYSHNFLLCVTIGSEKSL